jgi:hypothetical protein
MTEEEMAAELNDLRARYRETYARGFHTKDQPIRDALQVEILRLERELAKARGEEFATPWEWPIPLGIGEPIVLGDISAVFLIYGIASADSPQKGPRRVTRFAVLEFQRFIASQLGTPNDEVFEGHRLFGKGIDIGGAYLVQNSRWIAELERINSIHSCYNPAFWRRLKHYLFFAKEQTFEFAATDVKARIIEGNAVEVFAALYDKELARFRSDVSSTPKVE